MNNATDVIRQWQPEQHLYVKGDLGVGEAQLNALESWLDEHGPHWTVVLMQQADDEVYHAPDGRILYGMDAAEHALGHGLANQTSFGRWEHAITHETDGAVFVLFLSERKFSYYASDAQDRRGLGESRWIGDLDGAAIRAMKEGGRIVDAVENTVQSINSRLNREINAEVAEQQRLQAEKERAQLEVRSDVTHARELVNSAVAEATEVRQASPDSQGDLTTVPGDNWRAQLSQIEQGLNAENVRERAQQVASLIAEINGYLNVYAEYKAFAANEGRLQEQLEAWKRQLGDSKDPSEFSTIRSQLAAAQASKDGASRELADQWAGIQVEQRRLERWVTDQVAQQQRAMARRQLIRRTVLATLVAVALALVGVLIWLNRRRVPVQKQALQAFADRSKSVRAEMDQVLQLFDRSREILGTKESMSRRGYTGETQALSEEAFQYIDDLLIMSNEVDRVMDEAEDLVRPRQFMAKLQNQFSSARYERGINRISGEPLQFHEDQGIPAILQPNRGAKGDTAESISLTFEQVFSAFRERGRAAAATLDQLEYAMIHANEELNRLQDRIDEATKIEKELAELSEHDGFFHVPHFFDTLLPSAQADQDGAEDIATADPVQAVKQRLPVGQRKIEEALRLAKVIQHARKEVFPHFDENAPRLQELGYPTAWISQAAHELGVQADELFARAAKDRVESDIDALEQAICRLGEQVRRCAEIATDLQSRDELAVEKLAGEIHAARQTIAGALHRPAAETLRETDAQPDEQLQAARDQLAAVRAALQYGGDEAATAAVSALKAAVQRGQEIVDRSLTVLRDYQVWQRDAKQRAQQVEQRCQQVASLVQQTMEQYEPSAWRIRASDPAYPDEAATIDSRRQEASDLLAAAAQHLHRLPARYADARLLEVDSQLQLVQQHLDQTESRLHDIEQHVERLETRIRENEKQLATVADRAHELQRDISDPRAQQETIELHGQLVRAIQESQRELHQAAMRQDPFGVAQKLQRLGKQVATLEAQIAADCNAYAEATRAVRGAETQLATALRYVDQASRDGIPDSTLTQRCVREIQALVPAVDDVSRRLQSAHDNWQDVDSNAAQLNAELGRQAGQLRGELDLAQQSVAALEQASRDVFAATRWTGGLGTLILGSPGADELERARRALNSGDYQLMIQLSRAAAMAATSAIERAQREAERARREQARAAEAARRAEWQRRQPTSQPSFPSINVGGGLSSGGGRISTPSSSSSSRPSNSGFSRSGW